MNAEPIRLTVEMSYDDYVEGSKIIQGLLAERTRRDNRWSPAVILFSILGGIGIMFGVTGDDPFASIRPPFYGMFTVLFPFAVVVILVVLLQTVEQRSDVRRRWTQWTSLLGLLVPLGLMFGLFFLHERLSVGFGTTTDEPHSDWYGTLAPHAIWLVLFVGMVAMTASFKRRQQRLLWDAQGRLRRPVQVEIHLAGVRFDDHVSQRQYQWLGFVRFIETPNLLLLCPSDVTFEVLPKRSFPSPEAMAAAKALFDAQIVEPDKLPYAFPVTMPVQPSAETTPRAT